MMPYEVKLPLRLGPWEFDKWSEGFRRRGINVEEVFEIERRTVSAGRLTGTEYIIKGLKRRESNT